MIRTILVIIFLLATTLAQAQGELQRTFRSLTVGNGLSDLCVNAIYKDPYGFVWLGTDMAVNRFDGFDVKQFAMPGDDLFKRRVNTIEYASDNHLLVGNGEGLWSLDIVSGTFARRFAKQINFPVHDILKVTRGKKSKLYIATAKGLFVTDGQQSPKALYPTPNVLSASNNISRLAVDSHGTLWLATANGLYALSNDKTFTRYSNDEGGPAFSCLTCLGNQIYLGTASEGLFVFDTRSHLFAKGPDVGSSVVTALCHDKGKIYVATDGNGVHVVNPEDRQVVESYTHTVGSLGYIRSNSVYSLLVDGEHLLWIGFYQAGLDYSLYHSSIFHAYHFGSFTSADYVVRSFSIAGSKKVIGTRDGLFYIDEATGTVHAYTTPALRSMLILTVKYHRGKYYIGTYGGGMYVLDAATAQLSDYRSASPVFRYGHVFCFAEDRQGNLWAGTSSGLYRLDDGKSNGEKAYNHNNSGLMDGNVYEVFFDSQGKGWVCTENGMGIYDPVSQTIRTDVFPEGFINHSKIRQVYETRSHNLLFVPDKGDIMVSSLSMAGLHHLEVPRAINDQTPMFVFEDRDGNLWVGSSQRLLRMGKQGGYALFNYSHGLLSETFSLKAFCQSVDGTIWLGTAEGLFCVNPDDIEQSFRHSYPIYVTDLQAGGKSYITAIVSSQEERCVRLPSGLSEITLRFACPEYTDPNSFSFEYRLDGVDKEWRLNTGSNTAHYYNLPDGSYTFYCRVPGNDHDMVQLHIQVGRPLWAKAAIALLVLLLLVAIICWVDKKYHKNIIKAIAAFRLADKEVEKYKGSKLDDKECRALAAKLRKCMEDQRPYTNPTLKLADLSRLSGISGYNLSYLFSQYLKVTYYDFINEYRINEFKKLVQRSSADNLTLDAIAEKCGFSSRTTFFRSFKKAMGISPNEYIKNTKKNG